MRRALTRKVLAAILGAYFLALSPALPWRDYLDSPAGLLVLVPFSSAHVLHKLGIPGVLEHDGLCGWGICPPTPLGWFLVLVAWVCIAWVLAALVAQLIIRALLA